MMMGEYLDIQGELRVPSGNDWQKLRIWSHGPVEIVRKRLPEAALTMEIPWIMIAAGSPATTFADWCYWNILYFSTDWE